MGYLKASAIRRDLDGQISQISPEALDVMDREVRKYLAAATTRTEELGRRRITGPIMRGVLKR